MDRRRNPKKMSAEGKRPPVRKSATDDRAKVRDLQKSLVDAHDQQKATAEILRIISGAPTELQPVLDAIARNAALVCGAYDAVVFRREGDRVRHAAHYGPINITLQHTTLSRASVTDTAILDRQPVHVDDLLATEPPAFPLTAKAAREGGFRTTLSVPLLREDEAIGALAIRRREVQPFTAQQVALLQTFADQAVIAIENARLLSELHQKNEALTQAHAQVTEALEQQTATSEILRVISRSPTDVQPVFETIAERAMRLCDANQGIVMCFDGEFMQLAALANFDTKSADAMRRVFPTRPDDGSALGRVVLTKAVAHIPSMLDDPQHTYGDLARQTGFRSVVAVPMLKGDRVIGGVAATRLVAGPFSEREIALLQTFADQAVIAIENVRLFKELDARNRDLTEALDQQTATSEILRTISRSLTDLSPTFDAILRSSTRLTGATHCAVIGFDGEMLTLLATNAPSEADEAMHRIFPHRPNPTGVAGRVVLDRAVVHIPDVMQDPEYGFQDTASMAAYRAILGVPMFRETEVVGALHATRAEPGPFSDAQIELFRTFADQAAIAIENVRLFKELEARTYALTESLDQQTATSDILRVISSSPTDTQPVFDAIAESAARLCSANDAQVLRVEGDILNLVAACGTTSMPSVRQLSRGHLVGRAVIDRKTIHVRDLDQALAEYPETTARQYGIQSALAVPLLREGVALGVIRISRTEIRPFTDKQIALLQTFADQAVIAIENVRLFTELQEKNHALTQAYAQVTEALEQQTATGEILKAITHAQTDVQPVFDTIVQSAARLCRAVHAAVFLTDGRLVYAPANFGSGPEALATARARFPRPLAMDSTASIAILTRAIVHVPDVNEPSTHDFVRQSGQLVGFRSVVTVPMLREGEVIGALLVARQEPGRFPDGEVKLLTTFADQAVIAVENVRLFKELEARTTDLTRSVGQLTALSEVGHALSSTLDLETVLTTIVSRAVELSRLDGGVVFEYDEGAEEFVHRVATEAGGALAETRRATRVRRGEGVVGQTALTREPAQVPDITVPGAYESRLRENLIESGVRAILAVPMVREDELIGCLVVSRNRPGEFPAETIELLRTFATQSALAIQNARLFREIEDKSRQLEVASQHKSKFLANMSHELRTPLNAILGFSEILAQGMFGPVNEKQSEYLQDILESGRHLLSLINDILDLSKVEAGKMELEVTDFDLPSAIDNALTLVRERVGRRGITLGRAIDDRAGLIQGDERKVKQVLLNLLSNAIKFTPEGGHIEARAAVQDGLVEVSVTDTGVGIAPEDQEAVFEEFRQVGTADKKVEGTGLGLALCRKFVELHGGRIWVKSEVGQGSTFTFTLPVRREA